MVPFSGLSLQEVRILEAIISSDSDCEVVPPLPSRKKCLRKTKEKSVGKECESCRSNDSDAQSHLDQVKRRLGDKERQVYDLKAKVTNLQDRVVELEGELANRPSGNLEDNRCKICWVAERELILHPCTHMDLCRRCAAKMGPNCPWCRKRVIKVSKIYKM